MIIIMNGYGDIIMQGITSLKKAEFICNNISRNGKYVRDIPEIQRQSPYMVYDCKLVHVGMEVK